MITDTIDDITFTFLWGEEEKISTGGPGIVGALWGLNLCMFFLCIGIWGEDREKRNMDT